MAVDAPAIDMDKLNTLMGQLVGELGATVNAGLIVLGDRLGLYRAMAGAGPLTPAELAEKTGTTERYVREWLNAQAAGGSADILGRSVAEPLGRALGQSIVVENRVGAGGNIGTGEVATATPDG